MSWSLWTDSVELQTERRICGVFFYFYLLPPKSRTEGADNLPGPVGTSKITTTTTTPKKLTLLKLKDKGATEHHGRCLYSNHPLH